MNHEGVQTISSIETLKETYKHKLDGILNAGLTVENIDTFADEALEGLLSLTRDVTTQYNNNPEFAPNQDFTPREQEDDAFKKLGLPDIQEILGSVINVKKRIDELKSYLIQNVEDSTDVFIPPTNESVPNTATGEGTWEKKRIIPRLLTLLYILETDFFILKKDVSITYGDVTTEMVRQTPYVKIEISELDRVIYICDEEGNVSYVFDTEKLARAGILIQDINVSDKEALNEMIIKYHGVGARVRQTKNWRSQMTGLLGEPIPESTKSGNDSEKENEKKPKSEFEKREKKEFLSFADFQKEVVVLYSGDINVYKWYKKERPKHKNWPSTPNKTYEDRGWDGWPYLVGKENTFKKEFLSLADFQKEVVVLYSGDSNVKKWYKRERPKHKNWPSNPNKAYKNSGWGGFSHLVGREK